MLVSLADVDELYVGRQNLLERSEQVKLMTRIYKQAQGVLIFTPILCILWGSSNAGGKRLNKWEALDELRKSSAGFKGMSSRGVAMDVWRVLNVGPIACIWKKKEKIPRCFRNSELQFFLVVAVFRREVLISKSHGYAS